MYVALTRAKRGFFCTSADNYGGSRKRKPSQFLGELRLIDAKGTQVIASRSISEAEVIQSLDIRSTGLLRHSTPRNDSLKLPHSFSFSQLTAFRNCPLQYTFSFLLKIPTFGKAHFSFGKSMHAALQKFAEDAMSRSLHTQSSLFGAKELPYTTTVPPKQELFGFYDACWIDDWYGSKKIHDEYKAKGREMLSRFYDDFCAAKSSLKAVERDFSIKIGAGDESFTLKGRIDRIDTIVDGGLEIIDYKTGTPKDPETFGFADKEQLLLYQFACETLGEPVEKLTFHYLENGTKITFLGTEKEKRKVVEKLQETVSRLRTSDFKATPGWHCRNCDFREICEFRN